MEYNGIDLINQKVQPTWCAMCKRFLFGSNLSLKERGYEVQVIEHFSLLTSSFWLLRSSEIPISRGPNSTSCSLKPILNADVHGHSLKSLAFGFVFLLHGIPIFFWVQLATSSAVSAGGGQDQDHVLQALGGPLKERRLGPTVSNPLPISSTEW